jgi:hypothetical protein
MEMTGRGSCSAETNLWLAVLEQVVSTEHAENARDWLQSKDGRMVAAMAGVDADWISEKVLPACRSHPRRRDTRHLFGASGRRTSPKVQSRAAALAPSPQPWGEVWPMC